VTPLTCRSASALILSALCGAVNAGPLSGVPRRSLDRLLPSGTFTVDVLGAKGPTTLTELTARFQAAAKAHPGWLILHGEIAAPGEPLPWHPNLGLSEREYAHLRFLIDWSSLVKASEASLTFDRRHDGTIVLRGKGATAPLDGTSVDVAKATVRTPFGQCELTPFAVDRPNGLAGPWYGHVCGASFKLSIGERALSRSGLLTYRYKHVEQGRLVEDRELYVRYPLPAPTLLDAARGCDDGRVEDCLEAARVYRRQGAEGDNDRATLLYERACVWGDSMGCSGIGEMLVEGLIPDKKAALERLQKCCEFENPHACGITGVQYELGGAVARDLARAMQLYKRGCEVGGGNVAACYRLGVGYDKGRGVARDVVKARELIEKACKGGHTEACADLKAPRQAESSPSLWLNEIRQEALGEPMRAALVAAAGGAKHWPLMIKRARVKTVATYKTDEPREIIDETLLEPAGHGLLYEHRRDLDPDALSESVGVSLYGWISALGRSVYEEHRSSHRLADLSLNVRLTSLAPGSTFSYRTTTVTGLEGKPSSTVRLTTCTVGKPSKASALHPKLPGDAIPLECSTSLADKPSNRSAGFLLPGVGWYFGQSSETVSGYKGRSELVEVDLR